MKKNAHIFWTSVLACMLLLPAINTLTGRVSFGADSKSLREQLYNIDFALTAISPLLYPYGISISPEQVVIGFNDWLYLGDRYEKTITTKRQGMTTNEKELIAKASLAASKWADWLQSKGVDLYKIILARDKATIYPEFLPSWAKPAEISVADSLVSATRAGIYFDTKTALLNEKLTSSRSIYYKTDTHWNSLGARAAFLAFGKQVVGEVDGIKWLGEAMVPVAEVKKRKGGDLATFLRMQSKLSDLSVIVETMDSAKRVQYEFESGERLEVNEMITPETPLLVQTQNALNEKKVLWLRDSFGGAMSPFMTATFSEVLQLHYDSTNPSHFMELVESFKPDFVFVTVVERQIFHDWFIASVPAS